MSISSSSEFLFNYIHCKRAGLHKKGEFTTSSGGCYAAGGTSPDFLLGWILALKNILERKFDGSRTLLALTNSSYAWLRNKSSSIKIKVHVRVCLFLVNFLRSFDVWVWSGLWRRRFLMALCLDVCSLHRTSCHSKEASILRETSRHFSQKKEEEGIAHHRKSWACCGAVKSYFCIASHIIFMIYLYILYLVNLEIPMNFKLWHE